MKRLFKLLLIIAYYYPVEAFSQSFSLNEELLTQSFSQNLLDDYLGEFEILNYGFTFPLVTGYGQQLEPVFSIEKLNEQINAFLVDDKLSFNAYDQLEVKSDTLLTRSINRITYSLAGKDYNSFSYFMPYKDGHEKANTAIFIIPGSGTNEATAIHHGLGYHGNIVSIASQYGNVYTNVKPNDDFVAIHNNSYKLNPQFMYNNMINKGSSYSAAYLVNSLATVKKLKERYDNVLILGLSQGARAAMYNAMQSEPSGAIIASGFTILFKQVEWAGHDQFMIPGLYNEYPNERIRSIISNQSTNYLFSWGTNETGVMKIEATEEVTKKYLADIPNLETVIHDQGHVFPDPYVEDFLRSFSSVKIRLAKKECNESVPRLDSEIIQVIDVAEYIWEVNGTAISQPSRQLAIDVETGGNYRLIVVDVTGRKYYSNIIRISPEHWNTKLVVEDYIVTAPEGSDYVWYHNNVPLEGITSRSIEVKDLGEYYVVFNNELGCFTSEKIKFNINPTRSKTKNWFSNIYPNPVIGDHFTLDILSTYIGNLHLIITDLKGNKVFEEHFAKDTEVFNKQFPLNPRLKGLYIVTIVSTEVTTNHKLLIN